MGTDWKLGFYWLEDAEGVAPNRKEDAEVLDGLDLRPDYFSVRRVHVFA